MNKYLILTGFLFLNTTMVMSQKYETQEYEVVDQIDKIEIRYYPSAPMIRVSSNQSRNNNFGKLFRYIAGNSTDEEKIAMTTPVHMEKKTGENSMTFVLPRKFTGDNTPQPNDTSLSVFEDKGGYFAAIKYSGYTSTIKEKQHTEILQKLLQKENIISSGSPKILLYDSPYKVINRRNEILIPITFKDEKNK